MSMLPWLLLSPRQRRTRRPGPYKKFRAAHYRPEIETFEARCLLDASVFYALDGTGNNLAHPDWGAVGQNLLRLAPAQYGDGVSALGGTDRPSARLISDVIVTDPTDGNITNSRLMSDWIYAWGPIHRSRHRSDVRRNRQSAGRGQYPRAPGRSVFRPQRHGHPNDLLQPVRIRSAYRHRTG